MPLAVRKVVLILLAALSSAGCAGGPWIGEVDRSCRATPPGDPTATPEALDGLDRLNCYRLHIGLEAASLDARLSAAAQAHAEYLAATGEQGHGENTAHPSSTGSSPSERVEVAGFDLDDFAADAYFHIDTHWCLGSHRCPD